MAVAICNMVESKLLYERIKGDSLVFFCFL